MRIGTGAFLLWQLITYYDTYARIARTPADQWSPVGPLAWMEAPLPPAWFDAWNVANLALALAFTLGLFWRITAPLAAISILGIFSYRTSWGGVLHADNLPALHAICLACCPAASAWSLDALLRGQPRWNRAVRLLAGPDLPMVDWRFGWGIRLICAVTTITYLLAGVAKMAVHGGLGWASGDGLLDQIGNDAIFKEFVSSGASPLVPWAYQHPRLMLAATVGTLILEAGAPLALLHRRLGQAWAIGIFSMHHGIRLIMGIVFPYPCSGLAFVSFLAPPDPPTHRLTAAPEEAST